MSLQQLRAHIEARVYSAFQALEPPIEVMFDNVQETPPALPYAVCLVSYLEMSVPIICQTETAVEAINGNLQISVYCPRGEGMGKLELLASEAMRAMNRMYDPQAVAKVKCGPISGPETVLSGDMPYAVSTVSCAFSASVD